MKNEDQVIRKENKSKKYAPFVFFVLGIVLGALVLYSVYPINPLQQYIVQRSCNFITMADFSTAVCTDGTAWTVSPFQQ